MTPKPALPILLRESSSYPGDVPEWRALNRRATPTQKFEILTAMQERSRNNLTACLRHLHPDWPARKILRKARQMTLIANLDPGCTLPEQFLAPIV